MNQHNHSKMSGPSTSLYSEEVPIWTYPNRELDKHEATVRLIKLILDMPYTDQLNLLKDLEDHYGAEKAETSKKTHTPYDELREHPRKTSLIAVDCTTHNVCFTNFIQDISNGGVFIETNAHFYEGQQLKMNFSLPEIENSLTVNGKVVRVNAQGIGVQFITGDVDKLDVKI